MFRSLPREDAPRLPCPDQGLVADATARNGRRAVRKAATRSNAAGARLLSSAAALLLSLLALAVSSYPVAARAEPAVARSADDAAEACRSLQGDRFGNLAGAPTYIVRATWRPAAGDQRSLCLIEGYVNPTVNFGLMLPGDGWNGKYLVRGCGGSCGAVVVERACRYHVMDGYACLHTDMGHRSSLVDNNWTANNLQGLVDFGYRATHVTTVAGKAITEAFYAATPKRSYFFACSTGGRQGLVEAQRFPKDFDGIVAIAPASMKPFGDDRPESEVNPDLVNLDANGRPILPARKALLVHQAVVARCDLNDGLRDGLIGDPRLCRFQPSELQCKGQDAHDCLTAPQVEVVRRFYDDLGAQRGSEFNWIGAWLRPVPTPGQPSPPLPWLANGRGDRAVIDTLNSPNNPDLRPFKRHDGKLILVQGWDDPSVMPLPTIDYYETVTKTMGGPATTVDFARLFMVPGMDHCAGGKGAYAINYMAALEDWVERGKAPAALIGVHPADGSPLDFFATNLSHVDAKWFEFTRSHPAYPATESRAQVHAPNDRLPPPVTAEPLVPLLTRQIVESESFARAALFPQANVRGYMERAMWHTFYDRAINADEAASALRSIVIADLTPTARDVLRQMLVELTAD